MNESYTADKKSLSSLQELDLRAAYFSDDTNLLKEFYVPALSVSATYDRVAGFFSSNALAIAARGISRFMENGGRIRLVTSVMLSEPDQQAIKESLKQKEHEVLEEIVNLEDELKRNHVRALGWMLKKGLLEMKIAVVPRGIEHRKSGILRDTAGGAICFTGSDNETAHGWLHHDEQFHVYCSWRPGDLPHLDPEVEQFDRLWNDLAKRTRVFEPSEAFRLGLIRTAPREEAEFAELTAAMLDAAMAGDKRAPEANERQRIRLFDHQEAAIKAWLGYNRRGIFEMATGTGKTFAALGCLRAMRDSGKKVVAVIACPFQHLLSQWNGEVERFRLNPETTVIADSAHSGWRRELDDSLVDAAMGRKEFVLVLTTHSTASSPDFVRIVHSEASETFELVLVGDEVHGLGAPTHRQALQDDYECRLGLSATPRRWFDDEGTQELYDYFGPTAYSFTLRDAINSVNPLTKATYLCPYRYEPRFVGLDESELERYVELTRRLAVAAGQDPAGADGVSASEMIAFQRANIVKNARRKLTAAKTIIGELSPDSRGVLVYVTPEQIDQVVELVSTSGFATHRFTNAEGVTPERQYGGVSERDFLLARFADGTYRCLVAMKCLDEGVDVPAAKMAVIMASSGNPREYIQRIGRVLRRAEGKTEAVVFDIIVVPNRAVLPPILRAAEEKILGKELFRCAEIANNALNSSEALVRIEQARSTG